jgi:hypothetical protein
MCVCVYVCMCVYVYVCIYVEIYGIKDTYVVWEYVKKTLFSMGFMGVMGVGVV